MSKIKEKIKKILPDMKKGVERFPLTILCGIIVFLLSVYVIENSDMKNYNLLNKNFKVEYSSASAIDIPYDIMYSFDCSIGTDKGKISFR